MEIRKLLIVFTSLVALTASCGGETNTVWHFKREFMAELTKSVPPTLKRQDAVTGRFGSGLWLPGDQMVIYPLAAAWALNDKENSNPYYHNRELLDGIMRGGDALIGAQDRQGRWEFRKRDNSTWGLHFDPWVYSRWIRTYSLIRDAMPADRRERWRKALELGYSGIAKNDITIVQNIPAHHAMGLYAAGKALNHPEWCKQASAFLIRIAQAQDTNGFWSEHCGPVVHYNTVYVDALGTYYALSHDERVLKALERSARFHANFAYPDGSYVETIDERNPYLNRIEPPNVGFTYSPLGRGYLRALWNETQKLNATPNVDALTCLLLYGEEGEVEDPATNKLFTTGDRKAAVVRQDDWFGVISAYVCPLSTSRWIQDRQNFVSIFNNRTGLIVGGGNTKLQPLWSTFTVGDTKLLKHQPGDERPKFQEPAGLLHIPTAAKLAADGKALQLEYGDTHCAVTTDFIDANRLRLTYSVTDIGSRRPIEGHVTLLPTMGSHWRSASGRSGKLDSSSLNLNATETGEWFEHNGWRISVPPGSTITWPVLPHNPYRKDGHAEPSEGHIVLTLPFNETVRTQTVVLTITK